MRIIGILIAPLAVSLRRRWKLLLVFSFIESWFLFSILCFYFQEWNEGRLGYFPCVLYALLIAIITAALAVIVIDRVVDPILKRGDQLIRQMVGR